MLTEEQMRDAKAPTPASTEELTAYIEGLVNRQHDYGTCVYAMSMAATAAFNMVASRLGATGFQASCADMDVLRRTRNMQGPFMVVDGAQALYPQYDLRNRLDEFLSEAKPWLAKKARENLSSKTDVHPAVEAHWRELAAFEAPSQEGSTHG